jgi:hypothetical protein
MKYILIVSETPEGKSEVRWPLNNGLFEAIGANYEIEELGGEVRVSIQRDVYFLRLDIVVEGEAPVLAAYWATFFGPAPAGVCPRGPLSQGRGK